MNQPLETLMHEHRVIERALDALDAFSAAAARGAAAERSTVKDFADFFANFADRCHHGKEEDKLFVAMESAGLPSNGGPLAVMRFEHDEGRAHVRALRAIGEGVGALTAADRAALAEHAEQFSLLLRAHIQKEDTILYPMAAGVLSAETFDQLSRDFETFEAEVMGAGEHERFHELADRLIAAFAPAGRSEGACCCPHTMGS